MFVYDLFVDVLDDISGRRCAEAFSGRREGTDSCIRDTLDINLGVVGRSEVYMGLAQACDRYPFLVQEAGRDNCNLSPRVGYRVLNLGLFSPAWRGE